MQSKYSKHRKQKQKKKKKRHNEYCFLKDKYEGIRRFIVRSTICFWSTNTTSNMEFTHQPGDPCQNCQNLGLSHNLRVFHISLEADIVKCESNTCMYPFVDDEGADDSESSLMTAWLDEILGEGTYNNYTEPTQSSCTKIASDIPTTTSSTTQSNQVEILSVESITPITGSLHSVPVQEQQLQSPTANVMRSKLIIPKANLNRSVEPKQGQQKTQYTTKSHEQSPKSTSDQSKNGADDNPINTLTNFETSNMHSLTARVLSVLRQK